MIYDRESGLLLVHLVVVHPPTTIHVPVDLCLRYLSLLRCGFSRQPLMFPLLLLTHTAAVISAVWPGWMDLIIIIL